jgi:membrane protein DedA with SNARE-associated domain
MDWWTQVHQTATNLLDEHSVLVAAIVLLVEEAGVPVPIPGDFLMLLMGVRAREGTVQLWQAVIALEMATVAGATALYGLSRWSGRRLVYRFGRYVRLTPQRLDRAEHWIRRHGAMAVFLGRLIPGLRIVTAVACGVFRVPLGIFMPAMALGALLYLTAYAALGYFIGPPVLAIVEQLHLPFHVVVSLLLLGAYAIWLRRARGAVVARSATGLLAPAVDRHARLPAGLAAGAIATAVSLLAANAVVTLTAGVMFPRPATEVGLLAVRLPPILASARSPLALAVSAPLLGFLTVLWGGVYAALGRRAIHGPDWLRGLKFAIAPLATTLLIVLPLLGAGVWGNAAWPLTIGGEALRHAVYGIVLGLTYPVVAARRRPRHAPHHTAHGARPALRHHAAS